MTRRERSGLLTWLKARLLSGSEPRSRGGARPRERRVLCRLSRWRPRALLAVMMTAATWKDFDFQGTGPFAGTFTGGALPRGITGVFPAVSTSWAS